MTDAMRPVGDQDALADLRGRLAAAADTEAAARLSAEAARLSALLRGPVRVALVGREDGGKADVLEFLVGTPILKGALRLSSRPPVIVAHRAEPALIAGWWDGRRTVHARSEVDSALAARPDYLEFGLPTKTLEAFSFLVMPAGGEAELQRRNFKWLFPRSDMVLWCKPAREPWLQEEARLWGDAPSALRETSLYVATEADGLMAETFAEAAARISRDTRGAFQKVLPISATKAIAAAPGGVLQDARAWQESGARALLIALLDRSRAVRSFQSAAVQALLTAGERLLAPPPAPDPPEPKAATKTTKIRTAVAEIVPKTGEERAEPPKAEPVTPGRPRRVASASARLSELLSGGQGQRVPQKPAAVVPPEPVAEAAAGAVEEAVPTDAAIAAGVGEAGPDPAGAEVEILRQLDGWIDELLQQIGEEAIDEPAFLSNCARVLDDLAFLIADRQSMRPNTLWVNEAVESAADRIGELRYGDSEDAAGEAAALILQLSRDLCWTVAS